MVEVQEQHGGSVIALMEVEPEQIHLYGARPSRPPARATSSRATGLVEKPDPADAPSNYAIIGVMSSTRTSILRKTEPGRGGEIQLTDALQQLAQDEKVGGPCARRRLQGPPL